MSAGKLVHPLFLTVLVTTVFPAAAYDETADVYEEYGMREYTGDESDGEEDAWILPDWPVEEDLIRVDARLKNYPYELLIDRKSLSVGKDRTVRYTVVLRSGSGVDNVFYEGVRCSGKEYRRFAYGSGRKFRVLQDSDWKHYRDTGPERYRSVLTSDYFCPLNAREPARYILDRLESPVTDSWNFLDE